MYRLVLLLLLLLLLLLVLLHRTVLLFYLLGPSWVRLSVWIIELLQLLWPCLWCLACLQHPIQQAGTHTQTLTQIWKHRHIWPLIGCCLCDGTVWKVVSIANYCHYHHCNISHICRSTSVGHSRSVSISQHTAPTHPSIQSFTFSSFLGRPLSRKTEQRTLLNLLHLCLTSRNGFFYFFYHIFSIQPPTSMVKYIFIFRPFQ